MGFLKGPFFAAFALLVSCAAPAIAADTGSVSGSVFDVNGKPVADATVKISGDRLPVGRSVQTDSNGSYKFEYLLPGNYTVEIDKAGIGNSKRTALVEVDKDTQVDVVLGLAVKEDITVMASSPVVDVKSSEVSFNYNSELINSLPLEHTYRGLFQLIPGVPENRSTVGPAAGGDRQDNTYLIDGANITNVGFGYLSTEINELDVAEVNIKRAGMSAEFGRTSGTVTNAVSRSGSNRLSGIGRIDWLPQGLVGGYELPSDALTAGLKPGTFLDPLLTTETGPAVGVGGPVIKDHIFFYGSARYFHETKWDRINTAGTSLPDEVRSGREFYGKLTGTPNASNQLNVSFRYRPNDVDDANLSSGTAPSVATTTDNSSRVASVQWNYFPSSRNSVDVRYFYVKENNEDVPVTGLGYLPTPFTPTNLAAMGQYTDQSQANLVIGGFQYTNTQNYRRHEVRGTFTQFFDLGKSSHVVKAGAGYDFGEENLNRLANGWGRSSTSRKAVFQRSVPGTTPTSHRSSGRGGRIRCMSRTTSRSRTGSASTQAFWRITTCSRRTWRAATAARRPSCSRAARRSMNPTATPATSCGSASATRSSLASASAISFAKGKGTRHTSTGAAITAWIRSPARAAWRRAESSRRKRSST